MKAMFGQGEKRFPRLLSVPAAPATSARRSTFAAAAIEPPAARRLLPSAAARPGRKRWEQGAAGDTPEPRRPQLARPLPPADPLVSRARASATLNGCPPRPRRSRPASAASPSSRPLRSIAASPAGSPSDPEITGMMLEATPDQRWPMLLLAAVHLQTRRPASPSRPTLGAARLLPRRAGSRCSRRSALAAPRPTRRPAATTCSLVWPRPSDGRPLALIEVGVSRGLLLNLDRYAYDFSGEAAGTRARCSPSPASFGQVARRWSSRRSAPASASTCPPAPRTSGCGSAPSPINLSGRRASRRLWRSPGSIPPGA